MALRPENHITGDSAVRKIASDLIPEEWTISIPDSDYGLDMLIEVVHNNKTTGKLFFIQSKGTMDSSKEGSISFQMNLERIRDYSEIKLPVLFVYYSKSECRFWGRWMNSFYNTLTDKQKRQGTISLQFSADNEIDANYLRRIGDDIVPSITSRVSLVSDNASEQFTRFQTQVEVTARRLIGSDITNDARLSCKTIHFSYRGTLQEGLVEILCDSSSVSIPLRLLSTDILYYPPLAREECPPCVLEIIYAIALFSSSISSQSIEYVFAHPQKETFDYISDDIWMGVLQIVRVEDIHKVQGLFELAVQVGQEDLVQFIILVVFAQVSKNTDVEVFYRSLLTRYLESGQDESSKGCFCYNLANSSRRIDYHEAFDLYANAAHFDSSYKERHYWWEEVGGVLYLAGHFYYAELFYKKARRLSSGECRDDIGMLIADCQICQGKIKEAMHEELVYCEGHKRISCINRLKMIVTKMMDRNEVQVFDSVYWFNLGLSLAHAGKHKESAESFLVAWRLYDGDLESLVNACFESFNSGEESTATLILEAIREVAPEEGYKMITSMLMSDTEVSPSIGAFLDALKRLFFQERCGGDVEQNT